MRLSLIYALFFLTFNGIGQTKKTINTEAYYRWKTISDEKISKEGNWIAFKEEAYRGNDTLVLVKNGKSLHRWGRVSRFHMDPDEQFVVFQQTLTYDSIRQLKIDKVKKKKWPADSVGIFRLGVDSTLWFSEVDKFETGDEGSVVLISHSDKYELPKEEEKPEKKRKCLFFKKKEPEVIEDQSKLEGTVLSIMNLGKSSITYQVEHVKTSSVNEKGTKFAYVQNFWKDTLEMDRLMVGSDSLGEELFSISGEISNLTWSESGDLLAFNVSTDTTKAKKQQLYLFSTKDQKVQQVLDTVSDYFAKHQTVAGKSMQFSKDASKLFFQVGIKPMDEPKDSVPEDEKAKLDVWSWTDGEIQPQQLKSAKKDALGLVDYVYHLDEKRVVQLQDTSTQRLRYCQDRNGSFALLSDQSPYLQEMTWDFWYYDVYRVNLKTGDKELLKEHAFGWEYDLSPSGQYFTFWSPKDSSWYLKVIETGAELNLTKDIEDEFHSRHHDVPSKIGAAGSVHWLVNENACAIESQNNIWIIPMGGKSYTFTKGEQKNESYRVLQLDKDAHYLDLVDGFYLKSFNHRTKAEGVYHYTVDGLEKLGEWDAKLMTIVQSENKEKIVLEKMSFTESYNLFVGTRKLGKLKQITDINPQQEEYKWGTVELFNWKDYNGDSVNGLLYKPEDFDPAKSYPMIVYFYELYTDDIHFYYRPKPTASIVYPTEYVSNGYIVFIPDITYEIGHPAKSAYNAIVSGTDAILKAYPNIDSTRMGLQGQSWGGYQTAQLVTMTTRYACAMAGAPVSNMFSAYGGVRWGSGLSRTFQYETGQSRIGATIWEKPELYIENSPLFHLPKVETPLLIMHNDGDGAVPWYQGIELYQGLRRLQKPVWMLNYNDDEHNLMKDANRMDLSIRMRAFFDHYLLEEPAPEWMINGVPAVKKGKE